MGSIRLIAIRLARSTLKIMPNAMTIPLKKPTLIGIAADHGGYELKAYLVRMLGDASYEVIDFGDRAQMPGDDYPDYIVPLARAVAGRHVDRGVAICGSGVGASIAANKVSGVRACLISDTFSAHQGVEDDNLNMICLGGQVVGHSLALKLVLTFLAAQFSGAARHRRRLAKVAELEQRTGGAYHIEDTPIHPRTDSEAMDAWRNEGDPN
jgi:ribose 5-phosphate isomerase B